MAKEAPAADVELDDGVAEQMPDEGHPSAEDYSSSGAVVIYTDEGYNFVPSNKSLPMITPAGVNMSREHADEVLQESDDSDGHAYELIEEEGA